MEEPSRASPFGCVVGLFGTLTMAISSLFWRAFYLSFKLEDAERGAEVRETMAIWGASTAALALLLFFLCWRMVRSADMSSPSDPDKAKVRF